MYVILTWEKDMCIYMVGMGSGWYTTTYKGAELN